MRVERKSETLRAFFPSVTGPVWSRPSLKELEKWQSFVLIAAENPAKFPCSSGNQTEMSLL